MENIRVFPGSRKYKNALLHRYMGVLIYMPLSRKLIRLMNLENQYDIRRMMKYEGQY